MDIDNTKDAEDDTTEDEAEEAADPAESALLSFLFVS